MYRITDFVGDFRVTAAEIVVDNSGWQQICKLDNRRATIVITPPGQTAVRLVTVEHQDYATGQIIVPSGTTYVIDWSKYGILTTYEWWAKAISGSVIQPTCVTQVFWDPGV